MDNKPLTRGPGGLAQLASQARRCSWTVELRGYLSAQSRFNAAMPALTRRRSTDAREECWHIYYGDVRVGTIAVRSGNPHDTDPWQWSCGFYPGSHPGEHQDGTAATFDEARADFEKAWTLFLSKRTEADFQAWRDQRDWTARKYALWDACKRLEPPSHGPGKPCSRFMKCPAARYSTCTAPRRCRCMCLTSRRPNTPKKKAVEA